jgi:hypothetical protein
MDAALKLRSSNASGWSHLEERRAWLSHSLDKKGTVEEQVPPCLATGLSDQEPPVTRRTVGTIISVRHRIMVRAHRVTAAHLQPTQPTVQHDGKPVGHLNQAP